MKHLYKYTLYLNNKLYTHKFINSLTHSSSYILLHNKAQNKVTKISLHAKKMYFFIIIITIINI